MKPHIAIRREWSDADVLLLAFQVCDGKSLFVNDAYAELDWGTRAATGLGTFSHQVHGGLFNLETGDGGPEYAGGAFRARFHFYKPNLLLISTFQQAAYIRFKDNHVASEARLFLRTEPALLDKFIRALPALDKANGMEALLECVGLD